VGLGVVNVLFVGDVEPQASAVYLALSAAEDVRVRRLFDTPLGTIDLIVVAGWRHLIPPEVLALAPTVGFHSAKLPEYPGRAPVYWAFLRGDRVIGNTMLYLTAEPDAGDIIDEEHYHRTASDTPESVYRWIAESDARMLRKHLPALLDGTAPRTPQDRSKRGPLTTKDGYEKWLASRP
jgi:methionyl-tRNA formyltransferase